MKSHLNILLAGLTYLFCSRGALQPMAIYSGPASPCVLCHCLLPHPDNNRRLLSAIGIAESTASFNET